MVHKCVKFAPRLLHAAGERGVLRQSAEAMLVHTSTDVTRSVIADNNTDSDKPFLVSRSGAAYRHELPVGEKAVFTPEIGVDIPVAAWVISHQRGQTPP